MLKSNEIIVTIIGKDKIGIASSISWFFAEFQINIKDIKQMLVGDYFTLIYTCDFAKSSIKIETLEEKLQELSKKLNVVCTIQSRAIADYSYSS